ncbi:hypothetical protein AnigIFM60653_007268 [Aspergillus niger]|nr:hypothetical protein AnigIFM60653_007268 [Aspergillus niger]
MQFTKYILATAMALSTGGFAVDVDIAYTSNGVEHVQVVQSNTIVPLDYPGLITTFQTTYPCDLFPSSEVNALYVHPGAHVINPGFDAATIVCLDI